MKQATPCSIASLKKRSDFLRVGAEGKKFATPVFLLLAAKAPQATPDIRIGYTVTKKLGNAVVRNRIKRRFREAVKLSFPALAVPGFDYVLIARNKAQDISFTELTESLRFALSHLHKSRQASYASKPGKPKAALKPHAEQTPPPASPATDS